MRRKTVIQLTPCKIVTPLVALSAALLVSAGACAQSDQAKREFNRGVELTKAGKADSAIAAYEAAVKESPDYLQAHINAGALYYEKGRLGNAAAHLKAAVALDSTSADAYKNLALVHVQAGEFDTAATVLNRLTTLDPKKGAVAWAALGQAKKKKGDVPGALDAYNKAIKADPNDYRTLYNIGNIHKDAGRFEDAIASYKKSIAANPKYIEAYYNLAIASHQMDQDHCVPDYEAFLKAARGSSKWKTKSAEVEKIVGQINAYLESKGGE
ncbi:MAG: tetratricopeptide repeat protein [Candidatus Zixiibacteriota bacterium]